MSAEHYFEIRKEIGLGFFNGREQYDQLIKPSQGFLLFNGRDICWVVDGQTRMSDTVNEAISIWLEQRRIEEVHMQNHGRFRDPARFLVAMILFFDTEFTDFLDIELISIGLVSEDGHHTFYAERSDYRAVACSEFVRQAVVPLLGKWPDRIFTREALSRELYSWLASLHGRILLACDSAHDRDLLLDALEGELPKNVLARPLSLANYHADPVFNAAESKYFQDNGVTRHHALHDALGLRAGWLGQRG
ncbi:3'-5' exoribonuclease [Hydrogenophaga sp.]|uniref:3'-5' exoribonuclease n=1 Tax=Hydrogenophaga sp. TaxID=1904254 RepID=UPI0025BB6E15|nr:3'-5' exoribonuclease [Hydrogenophaga sp.]